MKRRGVLALIGGALAWPPAAWAQQPSIPVIGFLTSISLEESGVPAFRRGLSESGYVEGENIFIEYRHADGNYDRLSDLVAELLSLPVTLIASVPNVPAALALRKVTKT